MQLTLQMVEAEFGGVSQYLKKCCDIGDEDIKRIQRVLTYSRDN